jgi:hypothetical protein
MVRAPTDQMPRRLFIAFLCSVALALVCALVFPRFGIPAPWWLPLLAFALMAAAAVLTGIETPDEEPDESPQPFDTDLPESDRSAADRRP